MTPPTPYHLTPEALDTFHAAEIRLGRGDWTHADYRAEGLREADRHGVKRQRQFYADAFVDTHVPPGTARRNAWIAASKARHEALDAVPAASHQMGRDS